MAGLAPDGRLTGGSAFRHGVASGDPTSRRVVIWTRVSGATGSTPVPVRWRIIEDASGRPAGNGQSLARPETDWTVSVDVGGLRPDTRYVYDFEVAGEKCEAGQTYILSLHDALPI